MVIGRARKTKKIILVVTHFEDVTNWRKQKVYNPYIIKRINEAYFRLLCTFFHWVQAPQRRLDLSIKFMDLINIEVFSLKEELLLKIEEQGGVGPPYDNNVIVDIDVCESFVAVTMAIGFITLFREKYNYQSKVAKVLSDNSFAVYVFHAPIIIAASELIKNITLLPIIKFAILCIMCIPICFIFTHFVIRRIPLLKRVM